MKPTDEQIKEFWELCDAPYKRVRRIGQPHYPPIDLNNLFKYAVPKVFEVDYKKAYMAVLRWITDYANYVGISKIEQDPALALFWAIYKVIKGDKQ